MLTPQPYSIQESLPSLPETTYWVHGGEPLQVPFLDSKRTGSPCPCWKLDLGFQHELGTPSTQEKESPNLCLPVSIRAEINMPKLQDRGSKPKLGQAGASELISLLATNQVGSLMCTVACPKHTPQVQD